MSTDELWGQVNWLVYVRSIMKIDSGRDIMIFALLQEPHKSKKVQHANAKNAVLFEAINLIVHLQRLAQNVYCM